MHPISKSGQISEAQEKQIARAYGLVPLAFETNVGQSNPEVKYISRGKGYELFLTSHEAVLALQSSPAPDIPKLYRSGDVTTAQRALKAQQQSIFRMGFQGANPSPQILSERRLQGKTDYFTGNSPKGWHTELPSYGQVEYGNLYPGIDAVFYGTQRSLEYDFIVSPSGDPRSIVLNLQGTHSLKIDNQGNLLARLSSGDVELKSERFTKPLTRTPARGRRELRDYRPAKRFV